MGTMKSNAPNAMISRLKKPSGPPDAVIAKARNRRKTPDAIVAYEKRPGLLTPDLRGVGVHPPYIRVSD